MKNSIASFVILLLAGILMACGGKKEDASAAGSSSTSSAKKETSTSGGSSSDAKQTASNRKGKLIFKQYCVICHGSDGTLGVSDATDLTKSTTTLEERIEQVTNGKGLMTPYKDILSKEQILAVAEYVEEFRQQE